MVFIKLLVWSKERLLVSIKVQVILLVLIMEYNLKVLFKGIAQIIVLVLC